MRYSSARQMIFEAYQSRRGNSPIAGLFDDFRRIREKTGNNGAKLRSLIAEHKRNVLALANADVDSEDIELLTAAVRLTEKRLSEMRTALDGIVRSSNEGHLPDNDWRIVHGLEAGAVISRVESLPQHLRAMALVCWGPFSRDELSSDVECLHLALYRAMLERNVRCPGQGQGRATTDQLEQLRWLCLAVVHHHSEVTYPYNRSGLHSPRKLSTWLADQHGIEFDVRRWHQAGRWSWSDVWRRALTVLDDWESQALGPVAELIPQAA